MHNQWDALSQAMTQMSLRDKKAVIQAVTGTQSHSGATEAHP
jgi:hypothetical protein